MKKNLLPLCALIFFCTSIYSQGIKVTDKQLIPLPASESGYNPILSPAGDYILITEDNSQGLRKYDLATGKLDVITTDRGAGFGVQISADGKLIAYRSQQYKNRLRYTTLKTIDLTTGKRSDFIKNSRNLEKFVIKGGTVLAIDNGNLKTKRISGETLRNAPAISSIRNGQLYLNRNRETKLISKPEEDLNYLWTSISPDGKKMLYYIIEHGQAYVSDLDGSNPVSLGILRAPKWVGNDWVVGMEDYDDGHVMTASKIIAVTKTGGNRTVLSPESEIATYPSASADGSKIVYNTADGKVHLLNIEISK